MAMGADPTTSIMAPGPARGSAAASAPASNVGVRTGPNGRPPGRGVVPPPSVPVAPPPGSAGYGGGGGGGLQAGGSLRPAAQPAPPGSPAEPAAAPGQARMATGPELGMLGPGMSAESPVGTYTVGPDGQPQVILNEAGQAAYQRRMERFAERYRAAMPPEMRNSNVPIPDAVVGQKVFVPWTGEWVTV